LLRLLLAALGGAGYIFVTAWLVKKAVDVVSNPFQMDLRKYSERVNYEERISFIERFHKDFGEIVRTYAGDQTVFIFIDDLDRCEIPRAAELMQAIITSLVIEISFFRTDSAESKAFQPSAAGPQAAFPQKPVWRHPRRSRKARQSLLLSQL
jgi:hypothetical protein